MPKLIRNISAQKLDHFIGEVELITSLTAVVGQEDYIKLGAFEAYLQNFTKLDSLEEFTKPTGFGLDNNTSFVTLNISY
jgi:hypothetical protein